jgi:hypothetical protein
VLVNLSSQIFLSTPNRLPKLGPEFCTDIGDPLVSDYENTQATTSTPMERRPLCMATLSSATRLDLIRGPRSVSMEASGGVVVGRKRRSQAITVLSIVVVLLASAFAGEWFIR